MRKYLPLTLIAAIATVLVLTGGPSSEAQQFVSVSDSAGIDGTSLNTQGQSLPAPLLFVLASNSNAVAVIDSSINQVITQIAVGSSPIRIVMTPDGGKCYVSNGGASTVS